ncbi:MAG: hypothetical protein II075_04720 [Bacteroidales bacterium]|nr:hypothetical protein [Bacteroidales bacterium]
MKKILFTIIALATLLSTAARAQYGITKETYEVSVMKFPTYYVEPEKRTYCIKMENKMQNMYNDTYISGDIEMPGWTEVDNDSLAFVVINMEVQPAKIIGIDLKDNRTEKMTADGLQINHNYFPTVKYIFNIKCNIKSPVETIERRSNPDGSSIEKYYPIKLSFPSEEEARKYVNDDKESIIKKVAESTIDFMSKEINKVLSEKFYPTEVKEEVSIGYLIDEESPFKADMLDAKQGIAAALSKIEADKDVRSIEPLLDPWIEKLQYAAGELSNTDIAQRKAKEEMLRDLATLYLTVENFDQCSLYSQILRDTFKSKEGEKHIRQMKTLQADYSKHHQSSRHFAEY